MKMINSSLFTSNSDLWSTPQYLFNDLDREFHFTLDACANEENHKCDRYYTKEQNSLLMSWGNEVVFCNPPYGRDIGKWVLKGSLAFNSVVVMLLPSRTDTKWFHDIILKSNCEIRFIKGRLKFGGSKNSAPFPSMIVIFNNLINKEND